MEVSWTPESFEMSLRGSLLTSCSHFTAAGATKYSDVKYSFEKRIILCQYSLWNDPHVCLGLLTFKYTGPQVLISGNTESLSHLV